MSISNSNFAGYTGSKNLVQTRQKFQFIKFDFSNSIFQNPIANRYRDICHIVFPKSRQLKSSKKPPIVSDSVLVSPAKSGFSLIFNCLKNEIASNISRYLPYGLLNISKIVLNTSKYCQLISFSDNRKSC